MHEAGQGPGSGERAGPAEERAPHWTQLHPLGHHLETGGGQWVCFCCPHFVIIIMTILTTSTMMTSMYRGLCAKPGRWVSHSWPRLILMTPRRETFVDWGNRGRLNDRSCIKNLNLLLQWYNLSLFSFSRTSACSEDKVSLRFQVNATQGGCLWQRLSASSFWPADSTFHGWWLRQLLGAT